MKAIIWTGYGPPDVLQLKEVLKPTPTDDEVLISIHASTVTAGDCEVRGMKVPIAFRLLMRMFIGIRRPKRITILGQELAGEIVSVGKDVTRFKAGDQVFGNPGFGFGGYAEYICLREKPGEGVLGLKPENMTYEEAASMLVGGLESKHFLGKANLKSGESILINGAGGSIGTCAVQLSKHFGAEVTVVDIGEKLDMLRSIGADHTIDYTKEDFTKNGKTYDVVFDIVGKTSYSRCMKSLNGNGRYLIANPSLSKMIRGRWTSRTSDKKVMIGVASYKIEALDHIRGLIEEGVLRSVIDRRYPLERTAEAHRYVETGRKKGNVVITVVPKKESNEVTELDKPVPNEVEE